MLVLVLGAQQLLSLLVCGLDDVYDFGDEEVSLLILLEFFHNLNFSCHLHTCVFGLAVIVDHFDGDLLGGDFALGLDNLAESASTSILDELVLALDYLPYIFDLQLMCLCFAIH